MKYLILVLLLLAGCAHFPGESSLKMLASFDLKCLPEEIEIVQINNKMFEARCDDRYERYFRICLNAVEPHEKTCTWMKLKKVP